ncbi:acyl-CoA dehydrogenase family protein [Bradyrhizobium sp. 1]|uniref:acyl-CoA dehydrogenase family protein n=1 Tax=Bradyrhizobium sp. 1 TaxID=241591 RepID=UPI001FF7C769|nr:acyl-CoA dehydrogenase family protein [Bradyrhizobium sp. 1]MCK1394459.1 acyl-CoA dehydrogenase family protein [Bradyrhizobium sp. 1]
MFQELSEERRILSASIDSWLRANYPLPAARQHGPANWKQFAELGWLALAIPSSCSGLGGSAVDLALLAEAFGRYLVDEPYLATAVLCAGLIEACGSDEQRTTWLAEIAAGDRTWAFGLYEPGTQYRYGEPAVIASEAAGRTILSGTKSAVEGAAIADRIIILASDPKGTRGLFIVDRWGEGVRVDTVGSVDGRQISAVVLEGAPVLARLGAAADKISSIDDVLARALVFLCAQAVGAMQATYDQTVDYLQTRKQFSQRLSDFQVLRHRVVDMRVEIELCRSLVAAAARAVEANSNHLIAATSAKAMVGKAGRFVAQQAIQLHGGMGMTDELCVGHYLKRLMAIDATLGNADFHERRFVMLGQVAQ